MRAIMTKFKRTPITIHHQDGTPMRAVRLTEISQPLTQPDEKPARAKSFQVHTDAKGQTRLIETTDRRDINVVLALSQEDKLVSAEEGFRQAWGSVKQGEVSPVSELWDDIEDG